MTLIIMIKGMIFMFPDELRLQKTLAPPAAANLQNSGFRAWSVFEIWKLFMPQQASFSGKSR
ncbi:hypothetical protein R70331_27725 [Paenibacillus sp. FSL R7-0331]|nr:hypothetical protein R70331_27725 [Paenibacillus sp. FSL R7-0331]